MTWKRESHGLFDYESRNLSKETAHVQNGLSGIVFRKDSETKVKLAPNDQLSPEEQESCQPLLRFRSERVNGQLVYNVESLTDEDMHLVTRSLKRDDQKYDYILNEKDTVKLGRIRFRVQRLKINNVTMYDETREDLRQIPAVAFDKPIDPNTEDFCKFCYNSSSTKENPLITPCRCKDTVGLIHFECLKRWLSSKRMAKDNGHNSASYYYKTFECEICKFAYPYIFRVPSGEKYNLIDDIPIPEVDNLLVLESLHLDKNSSRAIHVILPDESMHNFKLGRGHEADIRINDISVSRVHATIDFDFE